MLFSPSFVSFLLLSFSLSASSANAIPDSPITLPLSKRLNLKGLRNLVNHDVARAKYLRNRVTGALSVTLGSRQEDTYNQDVANNGVSYIATIGVGNPPTEHELIVDTGSSNTWIGGTKKYIVTETSIRTEDKVHVAYGSGSFSGQEYLDSVNITTGLVLAKQSIGVAENTKDIPYDGILGLGPVILTKGSLDPSKDKTIPTVVDTAFAQGLISSNQIGVYFQPHSNSFQFGELTYGGVDASRFTGSISYAPLTKTSPAKYYWGVDQTIHYGAEEILKLSAGIVDTGSTLTLIATDAFNAYKSATGAVADDKTGLLRIKPEEFGKLKSLFFNIADHTYELTPNAQLWPRVLNTEIGGEADALYLIVADLGAKSGQGFDFVNGYTFLERYYTVYDTDNQRVGFAATPHTFDETN